MWQMLCWLPATAASLSAATAAVEPEQVTILGKAVFKGDAGKYAPKPVAEVDGTECQPWQPITSDEVLINKTEPPTLRNALIWIKSGPTDTRSPEPSRVELMVIKDCRFEPRIVGLQERQPLGVKNLGPISHSVNMQPTANRPRSFSLPKPNMQINMSFGEEGPFKVISPDYPWMVAWIAVFKHPYFLVTDADGDFEFSGFPPGKYELAAWHERFGTKTVALDAKPGQPNQIDFVFEPDAK